MFGRFTLLFSSSVIIDGAVFVLALSLVVRSQFRSSGYWLLVYAISAIYGDYNFGVEMRQNALGGAVGHGIILPHNVSFIVDLLGRIALLVAIWMFFPLLKRWPASAADQKVNFR